MKDDEITLENIIKGCKKGDNESFSLLVDRYSKRFYGFFYSQTLDRQVSDELLSEFYLKLVKNIKSYSGGSFEAWMYKVASNVRYDYLRKHIRERENSSKYFEQKVYLDEPIIDEEQDEYEDYDLPAAMQQLDEDSRELLAMRFYSELSFKDIAKATGKPLGTVLAKTHRAVAKMRQILEKQK